LKVGFYVNGFINRHKIPLELVVILPNRDKYVLRLLLILHKYQLRPFKDKWQGNKRNGEQRNASILLLSSQSYLLLLVAVSSRINNRLKTLLN